MIEKEAFNYLISMKFSFCSWNNRHYRGDAGRLQEVADLFSNLDPDVFGLIEFQAKDLVRKLMFEHFPDYDFAVTDSKWGLEITVGWRRNKFTQIVYTQKRDFQVQHIDLRPGGLLSVNIDNEYYNLLFLHTDSGTGTTDCDNRQKMFGKIWNLWGALEANSANNKANLVAMGDLNTMGLGTQLTEQDEIDQLGIEAENNHKTLLPKDQPNTWHTWGKGPYGNRRKLTIAELANAEKSNLDHVITSNDIAFVNQNGNLVSVHGWNQLNGNILIDHLWDISDHSAIYGEIN
jgi:hypothetical protein